MALMFPEEPKEFDPRSHEDIVFNALKHLSDDYYVFHSFTTINVVQNTLNECETDFVVMNREKGILCIEVKAGSNIVYDSENRQWRYSSGMEMQHGGPYRQAQNERRVLRKSILNNRFENVKEIANRCKFLYAVWFPDMLRSHVENLNLPLDAALKLTLCADDLQDPESRINEIFQTELFNHVQTNLLVNDAEILFNHIFCPKFHLIPVPNLYQRAQNMHFNMLLKEQTALLDYLQEQPEAVISGAAGTGKTMIAVEKARRNSAAGEKVLFLCFNRMLRDYLDKAYKQNPKLADDFKNVDFYTISALAMKVTQKMSDYEGLKNWLLNCSDQKEKFEYRHVIIDEGQDFGILNPISDDETKQGEDNCEIIDLLEMTVLEAGGTFYLFYDRRQLVQGPRTEPEKERSLPGCIRKSDCKLTLYRNCRNTREIAETSTKPLPSERTMPFQRMLLQNNTTGEKPCLHLSDSAEDQRVILGKVLDGLSEKHYSDVVILTMNTFRNSILSDVTKQIEQGDYFRYFTHNGKQYRFTTCTKFKGLEADAIVLIDISRNSFLGNNAMYFYVGSSRAKMRLELITDLSRQDCAEIVRSMDESAPVDRRDPVKILSRVLEVNIE